MIHDQKTYENLYNIFYLLLISKHFINNDNFYNYIDNLLEYLYLVNYFNLFIEINHLNLNIITFFFTI